MRTLSHFNFLTVWSACVDIYVLIEWLIVLHVGLSRNVITVWNYVCTIATYLHVTIFWAKWTLRCKTYRSTNDLKGSKLIILNRLWIFSSIILGKRLYYTVSQKKLGQFYFYCNFGKCWSILKILSLLESEGSSW